MFITEKAGRVRVVSPTGTLAAAPVIDISGHVATQTDRGLLGIAVDAAFATNGFVYLLYTYDEDPANPTAEKTSRLTRIRSPGQHGRDPADPGEGPARHQRARAVPRAGEHERLHPVDQRLALDRHGARRSRRDAVGRIGRRRAIQLHGPDRAADLRRALARRQDPPRRPQRPRPAGPPVLPRRDRPQPRLHEALREGLPQPVPLPAAPGRHAGRRRRRLGGHARSSTSSRPGASYGWPCYEGPQHHLAATGSSPSARRSTPPTRRRRPRRRTPTPAAPRSGGAIVAGPQATPATRYPAAYRNAWFFADYGLGWIKVYDLVDGKPANVRDFARAGFTRRRPRDDAGGRPRLRELRRREREQRQRASGSSTATRRRPPWPTRRRRPGPRRSAVSFSADVSIDPDGDAVSYAWDFESDGSNDADGAHRLARLHDARRRTPPADRHRRARRRRATTRSRSRSTTPRRSPTIEAPADGSRFRHGTPVPLRGSAHDAATAS